MIQLRDNWFLIHHRILLPRKWILVVGKNKETDWGKKSHTNFINNQVFLVAPQFVRDWDEGKLGPHFSIRKFAITFFRSSVEQRMIYTTGLDGRQKDNSAVI